MRQTVLFVNCEDERLENIHGFPPIIGDASRILILGSMPGAESLRRSEYYAHPRNAFWPVIYGLHGRIPDADYNDRKSFLISIGLALWDVVESCERKGSSDSAIKNIVYNDFTFFFGAHPKIWHVCFNGRKAEALFLSRFRDDFPGLTYTRLGSTSPAHAVRMDSRLEDWRKLLLPV
ncbi:MAG: DNA-deoxyinosine glycosylase [Clostridia bacterium]|nr:DNA-deoxyinosine glycosylase [Clostridia bacterium]